MRGCHHCHVICHVTNEYGSCDQHCFLLQRAIIDEINRESRTDVVTIAISYLVMFVYIAVFLGHIRSLWTLLVSVCVCVCVFHFDLLLQIDLKVMLGFFGVFIVIVAVGGSLGFLSYLNVEASLIILEVVPFLVLAVGVDNLFILVHSYEVCH